MEHDSVNTIADKQARSKWIMTNWHDSPFMIVKSADPIVHEGASLKKILNEIEALLANRYALTSTTVSL